MANLCSVRNWAHRIVAGVMVGAIVCTGTICLKPAQVRADDNIVIVIDAGHGGEDPGASGYLNGVTYYEKDCNLAIAQAMYNELTQYTGVTVYMNRTGDTTLKKENRLDLASQVNADFFVCLHNDSGTKSSLNGTTVYYQNANFLPEVGSMSSTVASMISGKLAALGIASNGTRYRNAENGDKYADGSTQDYYFVLYKGKELGIPAVIVEHAYMSNATDLACYLTNSDFLTQMGIADATAIAEYFGLARADEAGLSDEELANVRAQRAAATEAARAQAAQAKAEQEAREAAAAEAARQAAAQKAAEEEAARKAAEEAAAKAAAIQAAQERKQADITAAHREQVAAQTISCSADQDELMRIFSGCYELS